MKKLQRTLAFLLASVLLLTSLASCGSYRPRESTEREATEVFTLGESTVTFEVLYTFFRNRCEKIDGFTPAYFEGEEGKDRFAAVMAEAEAEIGEIYALLALSRASGIDPEGDEVEDTLEEYLKICVEGGRIGDINLKGAGGSYDDFLATMKEHYYMNDAVVRLMLRSAICEDLLTEHYENTLRYTEEDVRAFFESDECIRLVWGSRDHTVQGFTKLENLDVMEKIRNYFENGQDHKAIQLSLNPAAYFYMGRHTKDDALYGELIDTAFSLSVGETSEIIDLGSEGYFVIKRLAKDPTEFEDRYAELTPIYVNERMHKAIAEKAASDLQGIVYTDFYRALTAADFF